MPFAAVRFGVREKTKGPSEKPKLGCCAGPLTRTIDGS
jgi:hypothetical protein